MSNRNWKNRDYIKKLNYPRQTYAFTGIDWGDTVAGAVKQRQKLIINGAPMFVSPMPPGSLARDDETWQQVYGASLDSVFSIFDGEQIVDGWISSGNVFGSTPVNQGIPNNNELNIYEILSGRQQIQFVAHSPTVQEAQESENFIFMSRIRSLCMRTPMHMAGWGKTYAMRPTDPEPENKRLNDNEHKLDRSTWKVGPLDVRWDERRQVWRAFNDLIVDDYGNGLGTFVHSTNPDETCGFPFLRGKIEDVWAVRKTVPGGPTGRDNDIDKTATVCTRIDSLIFQDSDDLVAPLDDAFIVFDECFSGTAATCGPESTTLANLGIKTSVNFFANPGKVGPIAFTLAEPEDVELGSMYFVGDACAGSWQPGIAIDICKWGGKELGELWVNDITLANSVVKLTNSIAFNQDFIKSLIVFDSRTANSEIEFAQDSIKPAFEKIENWTDQIRVDIADEIARTAFSVYNQLATATQNALDTMYVDLLAKINDCCQTIVLELDENCSCTIEVPFAEGEAPKIPLSALQRPPNLDRNLGLEPEIAAADEFITNTTNREGDIETVEQIFDEDPPSPVSITIVNPCNNALSGTINGTPIRG